MAEANATLRVRMLGGFSLSNGGDRVDIPRQQSGVLLARLALRLGQEVSREELVGFVWPDVGREEARARLRQRLYMLGLQLDEVQVGGRQALCTTRETIWLDPERISTDLANFEAMLKESPEFADGTVRVQRLERAVELYSGPLLPGFYQDLFLAEQERVAEVYRDALKALAAGLESTGEYSRALSYANRLANDDPLSEEICAMAMRLHGAMGNRQSVRRQFERTEAALRDQLSEKPSCGLREAFKAAMNVSTAVAPSGATSEPLSGLEIAPEALVVESPAGMIDVRPNKVAGRNGYPLRLLWVTLGGSALALTTCGALRSWSHSLDPAITALGPQPVYASVVNFSGGLKNADFTVNFRQDYGKGYRGPLFKDGALQLIDEHIGESAAVWLKRPIDVGAFRTTFRFKVFNPPDNPGILADGFTFTVQRAGTDALGGSGGSLGYAGVVKSFCLAIFFHRARNDQPLTQPTWGWSYGGHPPLDTQALPLQLGSGHVFRTQVAWDGNDRISATMQDETSGQQASLQDRLPVANILKPSDGKAWVGFTGATGMGWSNVQILDWRVDSH